MSSGRTMTRLERLLVTGTGMIAASTMVLSGTIVNVAVPDVMGAFGIGQDLAQFLATAYLATMTASQLLNRWMAGWLGRRGAFMVVLMLFAAGGMVCAAAPTIDFLIFGRVMQGFSAGVVQPLMLVAILSVFPPERRGLATGMYISGVALALGFGPVVGGITIDALGWRYIFLVPLPFVAVALLLGAFFLPEEDRPSERVPFDWAGYALLCTSIFCLMSGIANGQRHGWGSDLIVGHLGVGTAAAALFVRSQLRSERALLDFSLFSNPRFAAAILLTFVYGVGNFSINYAIPVFGQLVQGLTPTAAGVLLLPAGLVVMVLTPMVGRASDQFSTAGIITTGLLVFMGGTLLLAGADVNTPYLHLMLFAVVCRFGMGFITPTLTAAAIESVPENRLNQGSGTVNFFRQLGGAFGINVLVALLDRRADFHADAMTATQSADNAAMRELLSGAGDLLASSGLPESIHGFVALEHLGRMIAAQASTLAYQDGFRLVTFVFAVALAPAGLIAWLDRRRRGGRDARSDGVFRLSPGTDRNRYPARDRRYG